MSNRRPNGFVVAVQFLTRLPTPRTADPGADLTYATAWFPAVGLLIGGLCALTRLVAEPLFGVVAATILAVAVGVIATGAFHEDGLADSADALWGGMDAPRRLEIMRDSRLGTYGVIALIAELALRTSLLATLDSRQFAAVIVAAHVLGRFVPLVLAATTLPARPDGQGVRAGRLRPAGWLLPTTVVLATVGVTAGWWAPLVLAAATVTTAVVRALAKAKIGGITGDILGAGVTLTALATVASMAAVMHTTGWSSWVG